MVEILPKLERNICLLLFYQESLMKIEGITCCLFCGMPHSMQEHRSQPDPTGENNFNRITTNN